MDSWKISRNDTSYRFLNRWSNAELDHATFCSYYRLVVLNIIKIFAIGMMLPSMVYAIALYNDIVMPEPAINWFSILKIVVAIYGSIGSMLLMLSALFGICYLIGFGIVWLLEKCISRKSSITESNPSIIWTWIKTKKQKFCPLVEIIKE